MFLGQVVFAVFADNDVDQICRLNVAVVVVSVANVDIVKGCKDIGGIYNPGPDPSFYCLIGNEEQTLCR